MKEMVLYNGPSIQIFRELMSSPFTMPDVIFENLNKNHIWTEANYSVVKDIDKSENNE